MDLYYTGYGPVLQSQTCNIRSFLFPAVQMTRMVVKMLHVLFFCREYQQGCRDTLKIKGIVDRDSMVSTYIVDPRAATLNINGRECLLNPWHAWMVTSEIILWQLCNTSSLSIILDEAIQLRGQRRVAAYLKQETLLYMHAWRRRPPWWPCSWVLLATIHACFWLTISAKSKCLDGGTNESPNFRRFRDGGGPQFRRYLGTGVPMDSIKYSVHFVQRFLFCHMYIVYMHPVGRIKVWVYVTVALSNERQTTACASELIA